MRVFEKMGCLLILAALSGLAFAQNFPIKPVRLIIPFAPGGPQEITLRPVAQKMTEALGQPMVIDFKPGAAAVIGADYVAKSAPDGYTLLIITASHTINPSTQKSLPFDAVKDFAAVSPVSSSDIVLVSNPKIPVTTVKELIALAKSQPGKLNYASNGPGASLHLAMELFKMMAGVDIVHIPYKGAGPALLDVVAGASDLMFIAAPPAIPQIKAGKIRLLGVASLKRPSSLPNSPTLVESGLAKFEATSMVGILAPVGTPRPAINRVNVALEKILFLPDIKEVFIANGVEPWWTPPEQFYAWLREDVVKWAAVTKAIKYLPE